MQLFQALNSRRIARSLVTVIALTFIQVVVAPVVAPKISTPHAEAVDVTYANAPNGTDIVVPSGVFSITLTARGGAGGGGGADASAGTAGTNVGYASGTFAVTPGDRITMWPGGAGGTGATSAQNAGGGTAGAASILNSSNSLAPSLKFNGTTYSTAYLNGGSGGNAGSAGTSGGGGGGGAGSLIAINDNVALVAAGGGGGGGGSGPGAQVWNGTYVATTTSQGANGIYGGGCGNSDGGGSGGGGGGWLGGAAGVVDRPGNTGECRAFAGSPGANFVSNSATTSSNSYTAANGAGAVSYVFSYSSTTSCTTDVQTYDVYTIVKVTTTALCTWSVPSNVTTVDLFIVGGGGGGAGDSGGGGGGGAGLSRSAIVVTPNSTMNLKVGYGGAGSSWGYTSAAYGGESTTVTTSTGVTYSALGGGTAGNAPASVGGAGGVGGNGGFSGGQGGTGGACSGGSGTAGKKGISNYFYGTLNTYAGGGGGGSCPNNATTTVALGSNGGGSGSYASNATTEVAATNGTDGTGGGGGGGAALGVATVSGFRLSGSKGGSGVILFRYATNSDNAFPASLASSMSARWSAGDLQLLDSTRRGWIDSSGTNASRAESAFAGTPSLTFQAPMDGANSTMSSKTLLTAAGASLDGISLVELPSNYTLFHVARYITGGRKHRIIQTSNGNWLSGHHYGYTGIAHHNYWLTRDNFENATTYGWLLSSDQLRGYRANGRDVAYNRDRSDGTYVNLNYQSTSTGFGINRANTTWNEYSDWQVNDVIVFNRELSGGEMRAMEIYLSRIYGLTLAVDAQSVETDTAVTMDGNQYYYAQYDYGNQINDTFTLEAWVNPAQTCISAGGARCNFFTHENSLVVSIYQGNFEYALYGSNSAWQYINSGVKLTAGEWHHIALVKDQPACVNGSLKVYLDGRLAYTNPNSPYRSTSLACGGSTDVVYPENTWTYIGTRSNNTERYNGQLDELKVWKVARTATEIASDMHSSDVTSKSLQMYYDFNRGTATSMTNIPNLAYGGVTRADLISVAASTISYTDVKIVSSVGPYTTVKFPRTYINQVGGWKVPDSVTATSLLVVGGGGGGGGAYTGDLLGGSGGGGGGGVFASATPVNLSNTRLISVTVGAGGIGGLISSTREGGSGFAGQNSIFGTITAGGGGGGGYYDSTIANGRSGTAGGGGGGASNYYNAYNAGSGGASQATSFAGQSWQGSSGGAGGIYSASLSAAGDAGGGGGAATAATRTAVGAGISSNLTGSSVTYGSGGGARGITGWSYSTVAPNLGTGGSGVYNTSTTGGNGSSGVVIIRWITASKPTYTAPTNAYLNVGMTETFTTNVALDSETAMLTRTFRWESTTAGSGGTYSLIKTGTGATNAYFSWIPSDTSTSGNQFLYRLIVTDSDTMGLFIVDTSTPVYAVINKSLKMTGVSSISKTINVSRNETYSVMDGTSTYRYTLTPAIPGVTIDSSTAMSPVLRIAETATVGTYYETLTVIDSVSAKVDIPLTIIISAPPSLTDAGEIVKVGQVINFDAANRWAVQGVDGAATASLPWNDMSGNKFNASTNNVSAINGTLCKAPVYSSDFAGYFTFNGSDTCYYTSYLGSQFTSAYTLEAWIRPSSGTLPNGVQILSQMYNTAGEQISLVMGDLDQNNGKIYVGFYSGNGWRFANFPITPVADTWMHIVGTYDGVNLKTYLNGTFLGSATYSYYGTVNTKGFYIGKRWDSTYFYTGSISTVRAYSVSLTDTQVALNYNSTKYRFESSNRTILKPAQKYGALNLETFTVSSGGDTKTITFAIGNRTGIKWDTTTAGLVKLSVQESLTPGTYYDTITVTDNFSSFTTLPIKFTISKADTITVTAGAATTQVYNKVPATLVPNFTINGFVSSDTGTVLRKYTGVDWTKSCATGGGCEVGDTGPGGGTIFYISPTVIDSATGISSGGKYLEVAPLNWSGLSVESTTAWAKAQTSVTGTLSAIGAGAENTRLINNALTTNSVAAKVAADLVLNGKSDWFLPSTLEVKEIYDALYLPSLAGNFSVRNYWTSTQGATTSQADTYWFGSGGLISPTDKLNSFVVRPIRAYSPDTITVTTVPTNVDSYTVTVDTITTTSGSLSNYENVIFQSTGLDITKARQEPLSVTSYVATFGSSYTLTVLGGSGSGASTETLTAASIAQGCALTGHVMTTTTQGSCTIQVKKAYSRNYFTETTTAQVYFLVWATNQPTGVVGSGPTIGLNGQTGIIRDPNQAPTISSLSVYTAQAGVTQITITGGGFNHLDTSTVVVKFWRNKVASGFTVSNDDTQITVTVPAGTTTGKVIVTTPNGIAVSEFALTITP